MGLPDNSGNRLNLSEIKEIELFVLKRISELTAGDHKSFFRGSGFDLVGLREWQPGDKLSSIDWPQSAMSGYDPMLVREFEEDKSGSILIMADASLSARFGVFGQSSEDIITRIIATIGFSGVFFQDSTGLFLFDDQYRHAFIRPRLGKNHVISCLNSYYALKPSLPASSFVDLVGKMMGNLKRTSIIPVVSDLLFPNVSDVIDALSAVKLRHDTFLIVVDSSFLFELPDVGDGWVECVDAETGRSVTLSRKEFLRMAEKISEHQKNAIEMARQKDIETVVACPDKIRFFAEFMEFFFNRRVTRKVSN